MLRVQPPRLALFLALAGVTCASTGHDPGLGLNVSASAPRGLYRTVPDVPAPGGLVTACLPAGLARFAGMGGYLGIGECVGNTANGASALLENTTGGGNTAVGALALGANTHRK